MSRKLSLLHPSKSAIAAPVLARSSPPAAMELGHIGPAAGDPAAPVPSPSAAETTEPAQEPDIMQLARVGNVAAMQALFDKGEVDATFHDNEGITPLHVGFFSSAPVYPPSRAKLLYPISSS